MSLPTSIRTLLALGVTLMGALSLGALTGRAQTMKVELHTFQTVTLTDHQFLTGVKDGPSVAIAGELRLPRLGTDRLPAVVVVHGSGGILANEDQWARELNSIGVAAFTIDGFTPRGIANTGADQSQLGNLTMINDAYRALELLAKHPRIDAARIGILGGSRGGRVALYAALKRFQRMHGPANREFAVYLPFYAPCYTRYIEDENVSDRPIRLFHGSADDWAPVAPCRSYVARLRAVGKDVQLAEYADSHHLFDNPSPPLAFGPERQTARRCTLEEEPMGQVINAETRQPFTWNDRCVERGATVAYNRGAHHAAIKAVTELLSAVFKLP